MVTLPICRAHRGLVWGLLALLLAGFSCCPSAFGFWGEVDLSGYGGLESRLYPHDPLDPAQERTGWSMLFKPEMYLSLGNHHSVVFVPFLRWDAHDGECTHFDIRELYWETFGDTWELRAGVAKVFWGVVETRHLVDIINQTDAVENPDGEDKLGQPMVNLSLIRDWGTVDLFVLPGFRERTFPGRVGRLRSSPQIDKDRTSYESSREQAHVDYAIRWSHVIGEWDFGLYHFYGTSREPRFLLGSDVAGRPVLAPRYDLIHQTGLDVQATLGSTLWKLEAIHRSSQGDSLVAASGGFEYTLFGLMGTMADLELLGEYHFDSEGEGNTVRFEDDIFAGFRLALNDVQSSELLFGAIVDRESKARLFSLEASRRIADDWKLEIQARFWSSIPPTDPQFALRNDDHVQIGIFKHF